MNQMIKILVIEDEKHILNFIASVLTSQKYQVIPAVTGKEGLSQAASRCPDLILLDLGLPDINGLEVLKQLREWTQVPILILTAWDREDEKVDALDAGADDYLTKPFSGRELLARLRVMLRRNRPDREPSVFRLGPIVVDLSSRRVEKGKEEIHLTSKEYGILRLLLLHQGKVMTHRQLLREIWGPQHEEDTHYLRVHIAHLRQKAGGFRIRKTALSARNPAWVTELWRMEPSSPCPSFTGLEKIAAHYLRQPGNIFFHNGWRMWLNFTQSNMLCRIQDVFNTSL